MMDYNTMDLSEFLSLYQPFPSPPMETTTDYESNNSLISLSQSRVSELNHMLLQVLFPSEDKVKTYLYEDQPDNNKNFHSDQSNNISITENLDLDRFYFKNSRQFGSKRSELGYLNLTDLTSASVYSDTINQILLNWIYQHNLDLENFEIKGHGNLETYHQYYDDYQASLSDQLFTHSDYARLRGNTSLLARLGYKLTLKLNKDNDEVQEIWNPNVAQQILSVDYSQLGLVKDCYPVSGPLDRFERFLLSEVVKAFQDNEPIEVPEFPIRVKTHPSLGKFICICKKLKGFMKICNHDKIVLLSNAFSEIASMDVVFDYNQTTDEWINLKHGTRFGRRDLFLWNRTLHDATIPVIEALPDKWRDDEVVKALISLIIIFNPNLIGLIFADSVRQYQYIYIYLLKRYLESVCELPCDASDNLYRLLVGVERFRELSYIVRKSMDEFETGFHRSLHNLIIDVINDKCV